MELNEDIFFYLDLTKEIIKRKNIKKAIEYYVEEKNKSNNKGHYGILLFQKEGNPIFITNKREPDVILNVIEENWKTRPEDQSFFENGLFYIFSYIAETVREQSKYFRVIVITDTPSDLNEDYQEALFNLVSKIKMFPTFIDIIRISEKGQRFFKDDVKLNLLASDTKGGIFYVSDKSDFLSTMKKLVKDKKLVSTFSDKPNKIEITKEDYQFYKKLAKKLIVPEPIEDVKCIFCNEDVCPNCKKVEDIPLKCPDCNVAFHRCCIINYSLSNNIGIPNFFRCPNENCDVLLQIKAEEFMQISEDVSNNVSIEQYLSEVHEGKFDQSPISTSEPLIEDLGINIKSHRTDDGPRILSVEEISSKKSDETAIRGPIASEEVKSKEVRIGGFFGPMYKVKKMGGRILYEKTDKTIIDNSKNLEKIKGEEPLYWSPSGEKRPSVIICETCGTQVRITSDLEIFCPNCGQKLR